VRTARWTHPPPWRWTPLPPSRWTLRARLVVIVVALLATVAIVIGTVSVLALNAFLSSQVAAQVRSAAARSQGALGDGGDDRPGAGPTGSRGRPAPDFLRARGQATGTAGVKIVGGQVTDAAMLDARGDTVELPAAATSALAAIPVDGRTHQVDLGRPGDYLALATRAGDGDVVVTALPLAGVHATVTRLALVVALVTLSGLLAAGVGGTIIVRTALRPLARTAAAARRVAELPLDRDDAAVDLAAAGVAVPADPRTEVGRVDAALGRMLEHIGHALAARQAGEARMRRFVSDASHELRTPLASIRGYAELTRRTTHDLPPDVAHAVRRVESEAQRMTGLVEELLLLARLDEKRALRTDHVDLTGLAVDAVADAHAAGPDHRWLLDLPDEPVGVVGDGARLHQVVANLLANARVHTPAGTTVRVAVRSSAASNGAGSDSAASDSAASDSAAGAIVEVVDDGPGIPADLLPDVFDRFTRADGSRGRSAGGTGLGLAIVAGVVEAHDGRVEVTSRPGRTAFRVVLPARPSGATRDLAAPGPAAPAERLPGAVRVS
jgi:two-component system OmpR family sensor kinase